MNLLKYVWILLSLIGMGACSKDNNDNKDLTEIEKGEVDIIFENYVGNLPLEFNTDLNSTSNVYQNANGDELRIGSYKYYVSNIELIDLIGKSYKVPESYYLIDHADDASKQYTLSGIPKNTYKKIRYTLGVDSTRNVSGIQSGALDPIHGMFWTWTTGYIMAKLEGLSKNAPADWNHTISFHLGGFSGSYSVVHTVEYELPDLLNVEKNKHPKITFRSDVLKWFSGEYLIDFSKQYFIMTAGEDAYKLSLNYKNHLTVQRVQE